MINQSIKSVNIVHIHRPVCINDSKTIRMNAINHINYTQQYYFFRYIQNYK